MDEFAEDLDPEIEDCPHEDTYADPDLPSSIRVCNDCEARLYLTPAQVVALGERDDA